VETSAVGWAEFLCGPSEGLLIELAARTVREPVTFLAQDATATEPGAAASGAPRAMVSAVTAIASIVAVQA
jgi:hypothetical protein